jgi:NAD(P)-dependent dehydrogenase (short-subunit alcohol dehydrogenase family)
MSLSGKTVLVTGATTGIGRATALALAQKGAEVVITARDHAKAESTLAEIRAAAPHAKTDVLFADLSSMREVRRLADEYLARHPRLDVLVNNAGAILMQRILTVDGFEKTLATNHLAPFLLTNLLLERIKASAPARIVTVASEAHRGGELDFDNLMLERGYRGMRAYAASKLANILFTLELSRRLAGSGVTANSLHPGVVASGFGQGEATGLFKWAFKLAKPFLISTESGARTSVYLASSPEVEGQTGLYFDKCKPRHPTRRAQDPELARKLWDVSAKLVAL